MSTLLLAALSAVAAAMAAAALYLALRPRVVERVVQAAPATQPAHSADPDAAWVRTRAPDVERRLCAAEQEIRALRDVVGGMQDEMRGLAEHARALAGLPRGDGAGRYAAPPAPREALAERGYARDDDFGMQVVELGGGEPGGRGVDLDGGYVVPSRSLESVATLVGGNDGRPARLYLNESIEIDHMALDRWKEFFDFQGGAAYRRYQTQQPASVDWNETTGRGRLVSKGRARQL